MKEKREFMDFVLLAVDRGRKAGADAAEAVIVDTESLQVSVSGRQVEQVNAVREAGIGIRLLKDQRMIFGSTNELSLPAIQNLVADLMRKVSYHSLDECNVIPGKEDGMLDRPWSGCADAITYDPDIAEAPVQDKIQRALRMEGAGLDFSPKVAGTMMGLYQDATSYTYLANSRGVSGWFPSSGCVGYLEVSAAEGEDHQSGSFSKATAKYADFAGEAIGRTAAERAVGMLGAKPIASCEIPIVVTPQVGAEIFSFLAGTLSADEVQKGRSLFAGKLGTRVAAEAFHLTDDGILKGGLATAPVDGEGIPHQRTLLISGGILKNHLYDSYTARKGKTRSTGNCTRDGFRGAGAIGPTNLYLEPGTAKPEEILAGIRRGFCLTEAIGIFAGINPASGDFSIPAAGFLIENGRLTSPVRGISIGGNVFAFLKSVDKIGDDLTWFQSLGCPTFSVSSIRISGAG